MSNLKVSIQLFSVRDEMNADMYGTLKALKEMGYDYVQWWTGYRSEHSFAEIRNILDELGLKCISAHAGNEEILNGGQEFIDGLKEMGIRYVALPWMGYDDLKGGANWEGSVEKLKKVGQILKDNGITFLYHNHEHEFELYDGKTYADWLFEAIPSDLLQTEFDTCWVAYGGYNPCEYLKKYSGRSPVVHLKDFICDHVANAPDASKQYSKELARNENGFMLKPVGYGQQDFPAIINAAIDAGAEEIVVEQDLWPEHTALEAARLSREYLKSLGY